MTTSCWSFERLSSLFGLQGRCVAVTSARSQLAAKRTGFPNPAGHILLPDVLSQEPLNQATTRQIMATLRGLPRQVLEDFTKTFCKRFQVPQEATLIGDRICQKRHHD